MFPLCCCVHKVFASRCHAYYECVADRFYVFIRCSVRPFTDVVSKEAGRQLVPIILKQYGVFAAQRGLKGIQIWSCAAGKKAGGACQ